MRPNIVTEAGLPTTLRQWWEGIPLLTSAVVAVCGAIYLICLLTGYDSFREICFLPYAVISQFQVYRIFTSILFHGSLLHVFFNMLALVPLGSELERLMGSVRLLYIIFLLAMSNAILHILVALLITHNPFHPLPLMQDCTIGFSGVLFSLIVIETNLSGVQMRSVFGLINVPAYLYVWILLLVFQLLMSNVSFLGHLCGILSGFAYTYGLFNFLIPGPSFYSAIEASSLLTTCVRRPKFILCTGSSTTGYIPTYTNQSTTPSLFSGNLWRNLTSWMSQRQTSLQTNLSQYVGIPQTNESQDGRFPVRGRTLGSGRTDSVGNSDSNLEARLLGNSNIERTSGQPLQDGRSTISVVPVSVESPLHDQVASDAQIQKLLAMGFDRTQVEVAIAAADGDLDVAVEILMSQQG
ncbi:hypothetical protein MLD38_015974 [Melastoma candidum]|uniref:Uncharacterized protein n=1 Tax=Melastoma candidum TaxID=119954 RepID=A0ACB9RJ29_9MYRT|nr:hypothetical protein MLD38_015974 [Melastoma candidum]